MIYISISITLFPLKDSIFLKDWTVSKYYELSRPKILLSIQTSLILYAVIFLSLGGALAYFNIMFYAIASLIAGVGILNIFVFVICYKKV